MTEVSELLYLKSCPRCRGDMNVNRDMYGTYKECLQCGHMEYAEGRGNLLSAHAPPRASRKIA